MADITFNPNELILERVFAVEEYNIDTDELYHRYTQPEDSSLKFSADGTDVVDAVGAPIHTFYNAQSGTFDFSNSLFTLDGAEAQFGSRKVVATADRKITVPVSQTITIGSDHTAILKYVPVGVKGSEIKYVKVVNANKTFGKTYEISAIPGEGKFTLNAETKTITLPEDVTGRVFVNYEKESAKAVKLTKTADSTPEAVRLLIHAIFHDPCNPNIVYAGHFVCPRAQVDPSSIEMSLKSDGKHPISYLLRKPYCDEDGELCTIIIDGE